jgi:hypothetical protein
MLRARNSPTKAFDEQLVFMLTRCSFSKLQATRENANNTRRAQDYGLGTVHSVSSTLLVDQW